MSTKLADILDETGAIRSMDYFGLSKNGWEKYGRLQKMHDHLSSKMHEYEDKASLVFSASLVSGVLPLVTTILLAAEDQIVAAAGIVCSFLSITFYTNYHYSKKAVDYRKAHDKVLFAKWDAYEKIDEVELPELALAAIHEKDPAINELLKARFQGGVKMDAC